ncbi:MAG: tRNA uridine-5-carboxymethylaminomethyl(34) synthesis GTPase MnmE, partial [Gammaproteobacteria bacterium]|nr:tRNA uridine-5-carboxymethylaminomethyl(34) synthesis GTPase MnmE [Gammaproteobacteria bacterium]
MKTSHDMIAAIATPSGRGGVGVVRVSGKSLADIVMTLTKKTLKPRQATLTNFCDDDGNIIDQG